jgi:hypothetical protein
MFFCSARHRGDPARLNGRRHDSTTHPLQSTLRTFLARALALLLLVLPAQAVPLSGTKSVGPTGDYLSITAAIADIQAQTLGGALVLELQPPYLGVAETFPLIIPALNGASAVNTLTIRPASGATGLSITSAVSLAPTVDLNGAQFVTIDGRPGGVGSHAGSGGGAASQLTIANTDIDGVALRFINEASGNTIRYTTLQSVNTAGATSGTVLFSTTTGANGNDNNTMDHCDIGDGASLPVYSLLALGTTTTMAQGNSGNTISNCNVFNFAIGGVRLIDGNTDWIVTGNSFYQTASRTVVTTKSILPILVSNASGNNFTVTGNFIGGSAPNAGGTAWTMTGSGVLGLRFQGIQLTVGTTTPSSVQGNVISNFVWKTSTSAITPPGLWSGIYMQAGAANIGTVTGNIIGSGTGTGSVSVTTLGSVGTTFGIVSESSGTVAIANNTIGSITVNVADGNGAPSTGGFASLTGIHVTAGAYAISNNTVGSAATANSLNAATSSTSSINTQQVTGIVASSSSTSASITGNTVANLNNNSVQTTSGFGQIRGIVASAVVNTITGNTVRNLSTTSRNTNNTTSQSVVGITNTSTAAGQTVSLNTVHSLANTAALANVSMTGIYFAGPTSGTNLIARNLVHSLAVSSIGSSSAVTGMYFSNGTFTAQNNMVRLGLDASGTSTAGASGVSGILDGGSTEGRNFYHNSVYLGGTQTASVSTVAFSSSGFTNARTFQNNLFVNARSNNPTALTGRHYAVSYSGSPPLGLTAGGNIFYAPNTASGGVLGYFQFLNRTTLAAWQAATGQDATSAVADPLFIAPTGTAATLDLHLQASNPAEGGGIPLIDAVTGAPGTVADDFDGQTRSALTPVDIGADAGNFTSSSGDIFAPGISYPLLRSGTPANRVLTDWATIIDNSGSVSGGASAPRLYFKKSTDADAFGVANNATGNGWKYVTATGSGPYSFTLDYSLLNGGSVIPGDTVQYFVVAQDTANNLGSSPVGTATASGIPAVQNVNGHGAVNSFSIFKSLNAVNTVGTGGDYASLTGAGGVFDAINNTVLTGNIVINVTSDLTETDSFVLLQWTESGAGSYTVTIQPDSAAMRTISGNKNNPLIMLYGADRVTIDGRFGGSGRYLTFRNTDTGTSASTLRFINDASNNTVRNCVVEGAGTSLTTSGVILFETGTVTGNDNNLITGCQVRDLSTAAGVPYVLIGSTGSSPAVANSGNTVSDNELFNFNRYGILINGTGNQSWTVSGNNIYEVNAANNNIEGIALGGSGTNVITGNSIHDLVTTGPNSTGIHFSGSGTSTTTIARNRIAALSVNAATIGVVGIFADGSAGTTLNVVNNQITLSPATSGSTMLFGLYDIGGIGSVVNAFSNSIVLGGTESGTQSSWAGYRTGGSIHTARDNVFLNLRTGGSGSHYAAGRQTTGGSYTVSHNVYAGTGAAAANFMDFNNSPVSFATWQSSTGDTASQAGIAGSGSFTAAMFVSAATGDLHLVPGGNVLVNALGTPIAGVTDDYDGDPRNPTTPSIGSDEFPVPDIAVAQTTALADGGSVDFGPVMPGGSSAKIFTITNPGAADLTGLAVSGGTGEFSVSVPSGTTVPVGGGSVTFTVTFTPNASGASGARSAALHIASNVTGTKNPFDIALTGTTQTAFQVWAAANGGANDPNALGANGQKNVVNFAFGMNPAGVALPLVFNGTLAGGGTIGATGLPVTWMEGTDCRALFIVRKDAAAAGLTYTPQFSADFTAWQTSAAPPTVLADDGMNQIVSVPYPALIVTQGMGFFHVTVTLAP